METIEVETVEKWKIRWVQDHCSVSSESHMCTLRHESQISALDKWPEVKEAARRCIIANRPLEEDELRNVFGGIKRFELRRGEYKFCESDEWRPVENAHQRVREAHDRKFPKRRTTHEQADYLNLMTYGECRAFCRALLADLYSRKWRPISEFVEDGKEWEFMGAGVYNSTSPYNERATHFRRFVRPEDE